ncbi:cupin domain-containing protein [Streptomyces coeruleorubidus]|uniref:cupin domain-containing protein n=1 Tax=Streptomyces coeruleorubidus TaxID=116188 RepID=UPI0033F0DC79
MGGRPTRACTAPQGEELDRPRVPGAGARDVEGAGGTLLISGLHSLQSGTPGRLLAALPPLAVIEADVGTCPVSRTMFDEITREEPGQQLLLDRALDLMLITALRAWFTRPGAEVPAWCRAQSDPVVGPALRMLHSDPAHPWTLPVLAARTGVSRANLARRFTRPP